MPKDRQLPPIRVDEALEVELMRAAADRDMTLSEFIRSVLEEKCFGTHGRSVTDERSVCQPSTAMQLAGKRVA